MAEATSPKSIAAAAARMSDQHLNEVKVQTQQALAALHALQEEASESGQVVDSKPARKLLSREESARHGMDDVFELPVEYDEEDGAAYDSPAVGGSAVSGDSAAVVIAADGGDAGDADVLPEADVLISRVGNTKSGYQSRLQEIESQRRFIAAVVVVFIGAVIATLIAFAVYKSGVVNGQYRLVEHPHTLQSKNQNHNRGSNADKLHGTGWSGGGAGAGAGTAGAGGSFGGGGVYSAADLATAVGSGGVQVPAVKATDAGDSVISAAGHGKGKGDGAAGKAPAAAGASESGTAAASAAGSAAAAGGGGDSAGATHGKGRGKASAAASAAAAAAPAGESGTAVNPAASAEAGGVKTQRG